MGGVGGGRRKTTAIRDAHNRILRTENPDDLREMALNFHKERVNAAYGKGSRRRPVTVELEELARFEKACSAEGVHDFDGRSRVLIEMALEAARRRGE